MLIESDLQEYTVTWFMRFLSKPFCPPQRAIYWETEPHRTIPPFGNETEKICKTCQIDLINKQM